MWAYLGIRAEAVCTPSNPMVKVTIKKKNVDTETDTHWGKTRQGHTGLRRTLTRARHSLAELHRNWKTGGGFCPRCSRGKVALWNPWFQNFRLNCGARNAALATPFSRLFCGNARKHRQVTSENSTLTRLYKANNWASYCALANKFLEDALAS